MRGPCLTVPLRRPVRVGDRPRKLDYRRARLMIEPLEDRRLLSVSNPTIELFNTSPALFVQNQGQWADESVRFVHQGDGANVAMTDSGPVIQVFRRELKDESAAEAEGDLLAVGAQDQLDPNQYVTESLTFSATFAGANSVIPTGLDQSETLFNYLVGPQEGWYTGVPSYEVVAYEGLYQGIDLLTWGQRDSLKYEFHVAPGVDYQQIQIHYDGISGLSIAEDGALVVEIGNSWGSLADDAPYVYQQIGHEKVAVATCFRLLDQATYSFEISGEYDPSRELVIDPDLAWSTYLGGSGDDVGNDIAVDADGNVYVTGLTYDDFPVTSGAWDTTSNDIDVFVTKINSSGSTVLYSTYLGGDGHDSADGVAVDASGNVYVTGCTTSSNFPTTAGAWDTTYSGYYADVFVTKLNATGSTVLYSTYLGGDGSENGVDIAVDANGNAYVTGDTCSYDFPVTSGAWDTTSNGGSDAFVAKVNTSGNLVYATRLGGSSADYARGIGVDANGNAYVTGDTSSSNFPVTSGAWDTTSNGGSDAFVAKVNTSGSTVLYSTYLGGRGMDEAYGIAIDATGDAYVTGWTSSDNFPVTSGAWDTTFSVIDAFVAKLNAIGSALVYSTYLGGSDYECARGIGVDANGNAYVTGYTSSSNFPTTVGAWDTTINGSYNEDFCYYDDVFVTKLNFSGSTVLYSTYLGGDGPDEAFGVVIDATGSAYVTGGTHSDGFPRHIRRVGHDSQWRWRRFCG